MCFVIKPKVKTMLTSNNYNRRSIIVNTKDVIFADYIIANEDGKTGIACIPKQGVFDIIFDEFEMPKDAIPFANALRRVYSAGCVIERGVNVIALRSYFETSDLVLIVHRLATQITLVDKFSGCADNSLASSYTASELLNILQLEPARAPAFVRRLSNCSQRRFNYIVC